MTFRAIKAKGKRRRVFILAIPGLSQFAGFFQAQEPEGRAELSTLRSGSATEDGPLSPNFGLSSEFHVLAAEKEWAARLRRPTIL
jgi:hypothetical protein